MKIRYLINSIFLTFCINIFATDLLTGFYENKEFKIKIEKIKILDKSILSAFKNKGLLSKARSDFLMQFTNDSFDADEKLLGKVSMILTNVEKGNKKLIVIRTKKINYSFFEKIFGEENPLYWNILIEADNFNIKDAYYENNSCINEVGSDWPAGYWISSNNKTKITQNTDSTLNIDLDIDYISLSGIGQLIESKLDNQSIDIPDFKLKGKILLPQNEFE